MKKNFYESVLAQLDAVAEKIGMNPGTHAVIRAPERQLIVSIPLVSDSGEIDVFPGYRIQHSCARGPC